MLDEAEILRHDRSDLHGQLLALAASDAGEAELKPLPGPYGGVAYGEPELALSLCEQWIGAGLGPGTRFILSDGSDGGEAAEFAHLAGLEGARFCWLGQPTEEIPLSLGVEAGPLSTYRYAQYLARATGHAEEDEQAKAALTELAERCQFAVSSEVNPAKQLAWQLWTRLPVLLSSPGSWLPAWGWQTLIARIGKSFSVVIEHLPALVLSGGFEARHETGDQMVALLIGRDDPGSALLEKVLSSRVDEVQRVSAPPGLSSYGEALYLWALGAWTSFYLALSYGQDPSDSPALLALQRLWRPLAEPDDG